MQIREAVFIKSAPLYKDCPAPDYPEYAFIGRSNVGKSSLINMLCGRHKLAKTSSTPGKTQLINHFLINESWYLADLPGFGFAKVPLKVKRKWEGMIKDYLEYRPNLMCIFLLIDLRHEPLANDLQFMEWLGRKQLPFCLVFTKADKLSKARRAPKQERYAKELARFWEPLPPMLISSSTTGLGRDGILDLIEQTNPLFKPGV